MKGRRDGDEEVVWPTAPLLFSTEAEEHKAPLVGRPVLLGFGSNNHKARISTWSRADPPSPHLPASPALTPPGFYLHLYSTFDTTIRRISQQKKNGRRVNPSHVFTSSGREEMSV